jgi:hypothetical protein
MKSRRLRCAGHVAYMKKIRKINYWAEKPEGKRLLGRPKHRWEDNLN